MIEVRTLHSEDGSELLELRFPQGTDERIWLDACTAYEGFSHMKFKGLEESPELIKKFESFARTVTDKKPDDMDDVSWLMSLWLRFLVFLGLK